MIDRIDRYNIHYNTLGKQDNIDYKEKFRKIIMNSIGIKKQLAMIIMKLEKFSDKTIAEFTNDKKLKNLIKVYNDINFNKKEVNEIIDLVEDEEKGKVFFKELKKYMYTFKINIMLKNLQSLDELTDEWELKVMAKGEDNTIKKTKNDILKELEYINNILYNKGVDISTGIERLRNNKNYTINYYRKFVLEIMKFIIDNKIKLDDKFLYQIRKIHKITEETELDLKSTLKNFDKNINLENNIDKDNLKKLQEFFKNFATALGIKEEIEIVKENYGLNY